MSELSSREREIFAAALDCVTPVERAAFLEATCGADGALRARVETLLRAHDSAGRFMEADAHASSTLEGEAAIPEGPGTIVDRYRLLEKIGEGGFGIVYRAEQQQPVRRLVALKIIKLGMDTRAVVARFEAERQALAVMDHPAIAKVLDGGATASGRPYFVMELVSGVPITTFCTERRLTVIERIDLFVRVCEAIQHAHQKGLIHRDLKPSNVLVALQDGRPAPKVIDFGIAKATEQRLSEHTVFSRLHPFIGTPAYMSPEQAGSDSVDVDTRSDIYSLGVLLYELLTDQTPFDARALLRAGYAEIQRRIREQEPPAPSRRLATLDQQERTTAAQRRRLEPAKLTSQLRGDLDRIVMKCLEKNRALRYESSSALATDLTRHLRHEPILARPASLRYRSGKFVRRHAHGLAAAALAVAAFGAFVVFHTVQLTTERDRAQHQAAKATALVRLLTEMLTAADPYQFRNSAEPTVRSLLDRGAAQARTQLADQPELQAEMLTIIGRVYQRLGRHKEARPLLEHALKLGRPLANQPNLLAETLNDLGVLLAKQAKYDEAEALLTESLTLRRQQREASAEVAVTLVELGRVHIDRGFPTQAEPLFREALAIRRRVLGARHRETATSLSDLGLLLWQTGDVAGAEAHLRECWEISKEALGDHHADVGTALANLALPVLYRGDRPLAEQMLRQALALRRRALGAEHPQIASTLDKLAHALREQAKFDEAESCATEAITIARKGYGEGHPKAVTCMINLAQILLERGEPARAEPLARTAFELRRQQFPDGDWHVAVPQSVLGATLTALGRYSEAEPLLVEAGNRLKDIPGPQGREAAANRARLAALRRASPRTTTSETSPLARE
ncbi:serine/threonine-protein kinase [Opitutus terrae]|uniref:Serine/threonine protein kinase with TPR repeats n=1 Tax=Opitutus terrae (strain DSM 11246 / JCM 15787 / PB90-1) TaxID=452637 RepID=B2A0B2_OPITP|nr:serine/threonine-protein kinase [Opitutus terrae]ACB77448.1 serine/threonine protein kinase with TPR repeats [Opitutus terrae PB90-1]